MTLSIGERRAVGRKAVEDFDFRALLKSSPREAVEQVTGKTIDASIEVIEEAGDVTFVLVDPAWIELDMPQPHDSRAAFENYAYALLRDNPDLLDEAEQSPRAFMKSWIGIDLPSGQDVDVRREYPGTLVLVVADTDSFDELDDTALDLVAGGGQTGSKFAEGTQAPR